MAARTQSKVTPKYKTKVRVRNWTAYEESLRRRRDPTLWFDADAMQQRRIPTPCNNNMKTHQIQQSLHVHTLPAHPDLRLG